MNNKIKRRIILVVLAAVMFGNNLAAVTFNDIASKLDDLYAVKSAELLKESALKSIKLQQNPGDIAISLSPGVKTTTETGGTFPGELSVSGVLNIKIPLGLSAEEKEKLTSAEDALNIVSDSAETTRRKSFVSLFSLYQSAWLLQEETVVLNAEGEAARTRASNMESQYKNGNVSLSALTAAQEDLQIKEESASQELMKQRIAWYELSFNVDMAIREEVLERYELPIQELPSPPELSVYAYENDNGLKAQELKIEQIKRTITRLENMDMGISVKPFFSMGDNAVSLEYNVTDPGITAAYSFPVYTEGSVSTPGGSTGNTWSGGVTFNLSYNTEKSDSLNGSLEKTALAQETARLDYMHNLLSLQIRTAYQQYLRARDLLEQAERDLARSMDNKKIVETKAELGQAADYEKMEAAASVMRAGWKVESARIELEKSYLNTADTASWGKKNE